MTKTDAVSIFYTDPNTGRGIPCKVLEQDGDGRFLIKLDSGSEGVVSTGDLYCLDESGRYLGGPVGQ